MTPTLQAYVIGLHQDIRRGVLDRSDALTELAHVTGDHALAERLLDQAHAVLAVLTIELLRDAVQRLINTAMADNPAMTCAISAYFSTRADRQETSS